MSVLFVPHKHGFGHFNRTCPIYNKIKSLSSGLVKMFLTSDFVGDYPNIELHDVNDDFDYDFIFIDSNDTNHIRDTIDKFNNSNPVIYTDINEELFIQKSIIFAPFINKSVNKNIFSGLDYYIVSNNINTSSNKNYKLRNYSISFGSIDETNNLFFVINKIFKLKLENAYQYHFLVGRDYPYKRYLDEYLEDKNTSNFHFYNSNFNAIYDFLKFGDAFIGCCGVTSYEALHFGLPIINIVQNELQYRNAQFLQDMYGMPNLGFYPDTDKFSDTFYKYMPQNFIKLQESSSDIISGSGLHNVVNQLTKIFK